MWIAQIEIATYNVPRLVRTFLARVSENVRIETEMTARVLASRVRDTLEIQAGMKELPADLRKQLWAYRDSIGVVSSRRRAGRGDLRLYVTHDPKFNRVAQRLEYGTDKNPPVPHWRRVAGEVPELLMDHMRLAAEATASDVWKRVSRLRRIQKFQSRYRKGPRKGGS